MRGAMAARLNCLHRTYYLPSMTGIATAIYESDVAAAPFNLAEQQRERIAEQLAGRRELAEAPIRSRSPPACARTG